MIRSVNPEWDTSEHQWHYNKIKAEKFIYQNSTYENVIVGSSLSTRLIMRDLPNNFYNLSFGGQSIYDGLEILKRSDKQPKKIFIEINVLFKPMNDAFIQSLFNPVLRAAKEQLPIMKSQNQPIGIIGNNMHVRRFVFHLLNGYQTVMRKIGGYNPANAAGTLAGEMDFMLEQQMDAYRHLPDKEMIFKSITLLSEYVSIFKHRGIQVAFFEMPVHPKLADQKRAVETRKIINTYFGKERIIPQPNCHEYGTTDGVHLNLESARKYTVYLKNRILQL